MALDIRYNGIRPLEKHFNFSVQDNDENDIINFIIEGNVSSLLTLAELAQCEMYLKVESAGGEYLDKIKVEGTYDSVNNKIIISHTLTSKTTQYVNVGLQIQFQSIDTELIAQTEIVGLHLSGSIRADETIPEKYPSELVRFERELAEQEIEVANHETRIEALENAEIDAYTKTETDELLSHKVDKVEGMGLSHNDFTDADKTKLDNDYSKTEIDTLLDAKQDTLESGTNIKTINNQSILGNGNIQIQSEKEVVITNDVDSYKNESGVDKVIRELESSGTVEKTYLIDKIYHESTLVECNATTEENDVLLDEDEQGLADALGGYDAIYELFGGNTSFDGWKGLYTLYYDEDEVIEGIKFAPNNDTEYGFFQLTDCTSNQVIKVVVGKYFEYDEHGNKVFDENCCIYSDNFYDGESIYDDTIEITEERQEFTLKTDNFGNLYFDSDNGEGTGRFILYSISKGQPAYTEYKKREIGKLPTDNVIIEKVWLTYDDEMSIRHTYLGLNDDKNFVNDPTRIWLHFKTNAISPRIEEEIEKGRFAIRFDYPISTKCGSQITEHDPFITMAKNQKAYGGGIRSFARSFKIRQSEGDGYLKQEKATFLLNTLVFVNDDDIKTNRYGEKYIDKKISLWEFTTKLCYFTNGLQMQPITNESINSETQDNYIFSSMLDGAYCCGIPRLHQVADFEFVGNAKNKIFFYGSYFTNYKNTTNSRKLNPAFTCYYVAKMSWYDASQDLDLKSWYLTNNQCKRSLRFHCIGDLNNFCLCKSNVDDYLGKKGSKWAYMSAQPRCVILNDNYETAEYAFLKKFPQADQKIRLMCKYILNAVVDYNCVLPIFRTIITQK